MRGRADAEQVRAQVEAGVFAKVGIKIFEPDREFMIERHFHTGARRPADMGFMMTADRKSAGRIEQEISGWETEAAAQGGELSHFAAQHSGNLNIGFDAKETGVIGSIVAGMNAAKGSVALSTAGAPAGISAEISALPDRCARGRYRRPEFVVRIVGGLGNAATQ
jgi:hypothetical protein